MGPKISPIPLIASSMAITVSTFSDQISDANEYAAIFRIADAMPWRKRKRMDIVIVVAWPFYPSTKPKQNTETPMSTRAKQMSLGWPKSSIIRAT